MHSFPDFDYEALRSLAKRILSSRKTIRDDTQVKDWQLDDLLTYATREKLIVVEDLDSKFWRSENPEGRDFKLESVPRYQMADELERLVAAEIQRRQGLTTAPVMPPAHVKKKQAPRYMAHAFYLHFLELGLEGKSEIKKWASEKGIFSPGTFYNAWLKVGNRLSYRGSIEDLTAAIEMLKAAGKDTKKAELALGNLKKLPEKRKS